MNKKYIDVRRINKKMFARQFKYKRNWLRLGCAVGCASLSFVIPDLSLGLIVGIMLLSPVSLRSQIKERVKEIRFKINKRFVLWGLI